MTRPYGELAGGWWQAISSPSGCALHAEIILSAARRPVRAILELGSGGGNNALHMKRHFAITLVEPAGGMRRLSLALNNECEHLPGHVRTVRLA